MPAVRIEAEAFTDARIELLGDLLGTCKFDALGRLAWVWRLCTSQQASQLDWQMVSLYVDPEHLITAGLAEQAPNSAAGRAMIRIKGTEGRIEWLAKLRANALAGGKARASQLATQSQARAKPDLSALTLAPTLTTTKRDKRLRSALTAHERAVVTVVLSRLSNQTGVRYQGSAVHERLIAARLREGITEIDLRKVISYCADKCGWRDDPKMATYLRPETLFGPQSIAKYLDAARTWFEQLGPEMQPIAEAGE